MAPTLRNILSCWNYTLYPWKLNVGFWCWNFLKPEAKNNFQRCKPTLFYSKTDICSHGAVARPPFECRSIRPGPPYIHIWNERLGADIITLKKEMMHMKIDSYGWSWSRRIRPDIFLIALNRPTGRQTHARVQIACQLAGNSWRKELTVAAFKAMSNGHSHWHRQSASTHTRWWK